MKWIVLFCFFFVMQVFGADMKVIAFAQDTMANDFRKAQVFEAKDMASKFDNIKFVYSDANGQTSMLIRQIEKFILDKVDVLIVGTNDAKAVVPVISKARKNKIEVIILDRGIDGTDYSAFINSDNIKIGEIGASYIAKQLDGKGTVLLFEGLQKADVTHLRSKGFLNEIGKSKDIKVIKRTGNYLRKDAIVEMEKLVQSGIKIDAIFSQSDSMLSGVRAVLEKNNIDATKIIMVGCDYTSEAQQSIKNGTQTGSVLFPLGGVQAIETAIKLIVKEKVPKHIVIPVKLVTKENADKVKPIF